MQENLDIQSTKRPWILVCYEAYQSEHQAREYELKKSSWHKKQLFDRLFGSKDE